MNIINKALLVTTLIGATHALVAMEKAPAQTEEKKQVSERTEQALIAELAKAVKQKNFQRYFTLLSQEPVEKQKKLCNAGLDQVKCNASKKALHFAAEQGNNGAIKKLLELGAEVEDYDSDGMSAFLFAAQSGNPETLSVLLEKGAHKASSNDAALNAPNIAAARNNIPVLIALIKEHGFDPNRQLLLHTAATNGHIAAINTLLELGARKDTVSMNGATALHTAAEYGKTAAAEALIVDHGFDPNVADRVGRTPLFYAVQQNGNLETFNALIKHGAHAAENIRDGENGSNILHYAATGNKPGIIVKLIRDYNFNPNSETTYGSTPLGEAITSNACMAAFTLVIAGAQISNREKERIFDLSGSCLKALKSLADTQTALDGLEKESLAPWDPNVADDTNRATPLISAAKKGCINCIQILLKDPRTNPNIQDTRKKTALHRLIECWLSNGNIIHRPAICAHLLNLRRTNVGIKDEEGKTARQYVEKLIEDGYSRYNDMPEKLIQLFELRKMRVQAYLSLKNARCTEHCEGKPVPTPAATSG